MSCVTNLSDIVDQVRFTEAGVPEDKDVWDSEVNVVVAGWVECAMGTEQLVDVMIEALAAPCAGLAGADSDVGVMIGGSSWSPKPVWVISG